MFINLFSHQVLNISW